MKCDLVFTVRCVCMINTGGMVPAGLTAAPTRQCACRIALPVWCELVSQQHWYVNALAELLRSTDEGL